MTGSPLTRRSASAALALFPFVIDGVLTTATAAAARERGAPHTVLSPVEAATLDALGETLVPGARAAGLSHFVDANLARPPDDSLLMLRYLDVPPPHAAFYRAGLAALDAHARTTARAAYAALPDAEPLTRALLNTQPPGWSGPPAALLMFAVRSDAVDIVYGTVAGFAALGIPYLAHIEPPSRW